MEKPRNRREGSLEVSNCFNAFLQLFRCSSSFIFLQLFCRLKVTIKHFSTEQTLKASVVAKLDKLIDEVKDDGAAGGAAGDTDLIPKMYYSNQSDPSYAYDVSQPKHSHLCN